MSPVRMIHRFWMGRPMPEEYAGFGDRWAELNPEWQVILWDVTDIWEFASLRPLFRDLFERDGDRGSIELAVQVADVMGYAIVERHGGAYFNCDIEPLRPLADLHIPNQAWASFENNEDGRVVNAAIGSPVRHDPFWRGLLSGLSDRYFANPTAEMVETTGPAYLTDYAQGHRNQIYVYPTAAFNSVHWKQIPQGGDAHGFLYPEEAIGIHHWGHKKDGRSNRIETATM